MSAVSIRNVSKAFNEGKSNQVDALREVSLDVEPGEFISLIGPSGCGKSTLLRLIANLLEPTAGEVAVNCKSAAQARLDQTTALRFSRPAYLIGAQCAKTSSCRSSSKAGTKAPVEPVPKKCCSSFSCPNSLTIIRGSCRVACSSASQLLEHWQRIHHCS